MEQHKVLLIIVAVTVVLAAVIGVGIWLFYPKGDEAVESLARGPAESTGFEWEPLDYLSGDSDIPGLDEMLEDELDEFEVTYGVADDYGVTEESSSDTAPRSSDVQPADTDSAVPESTDRRPGLIVDNQVQPQPSTTGVASTPSQRDPPVGVSESRGTASAGTTSAGTTTLPSITTEESDDEVEVTTRSYWVQVISSPNRDTVEQAQKTLDDHQLGTRILTKQIDDTTYYRLRLGPFAVRAEAEKFLAWVQDIDGFSDSMIFVDYSTPTIAAVAR